MVIKKTSASITVDQPSTVQISDQPLNGTYRITCPILNNDIASNPITTEDIKLTENPRWIKEKIYKNCSGTYDKLDVWYAPTYPYAQNGVGLYIKFTGMSGNQTQMRIVPSTNPNTTL